MSYNLSRKGNASRETPASFPKDLAKLVNEGSYTDEKIFSAGERAL